LAYQFYVKLTRGIFMQCSHPQNSRVVLSIAFSSFIGIYTLIMGMGCGGGDKLVPDPSPTVTPTLNSTATPTPIASPTPTPVPTPTPTPTSAPVSTRKILFGGYRDGSYTIYSMNADGSNQKAVIPAPLPPRRLPVYGNPVWSPDGSKIAFAVAPDYGREHEIYVMNADGSSIIRLTNNTVDDISPAWSPDGGMIAFVSSDESLGNGIYVMNVDGSNLARLTNTDRRGESPSWSPNGRSILFSAYDGVSRIYIMDSNGENQRPLTNNQYWSNFSPRWSPNGNKITFSSSQHGLEEIYVMNSDGSNEVRLTNNRNYDGQPTWSPDGNKIAFTSNRDARFEIYVMDIDSTNQTRLTYSGVPEYANVPSWFN
jgi:Tol biopolymer transport system component